MSHLSLRIHGPLDLICLNVQDNYWLITHIILQYAKATRALRSAKWCRMPPLLLALPIFLLELATQPTWQSRQDWALTLPGANVAFTQIVTERLSQRKVSTQKFLTLQQLLTWPARPQRKTNCDIRDICSCQDSSGTSHLPTEFCEIRATCIRNRNNMKERILEEGSYL